MFILYKNIVLVQIYRNFKVLYIHGYSGQSEKVIVDKNKQIKME